MRIIRYDNGPVANRTEYDHDGDLSIYDAAMIYGRTDDTIELYNDAGTLVAMATWPQGSKVYMYCTGKNLSPNPSLRVWRYHD